MTRRAERRTALDILYEADVTGRPPVEVIDEWAALGQDVPAFARDLATGVAEQLDELDALIGEHAEDWTVPRMAAVDRNILRVAAYELLHRADVPTGAAIDEAVRAAKELSTEDSGGFVNGILGRIAREAGRT